MTQIYIIKCIVKIIVLGFQSGDSDITRTSARGRHENAHVGFHLISLPKLSQKL